MRTWVALVAIWAAVARGDEGRCKPITIPLCHDMPYNLTSSPNFLEHRDQREAALKLHEFVPLIEVGCSKHLKFFLCSLFAPMCTEQVDALIPSCQSICREVKSRCLPVLQQFNFVWPPMLDCQRLPTPDKNALCMEFPNLTNAPAHEHHNAPVGGAGPPKMAFATVRHAEPPSCPPTFTPVLGRALHEYRCLPKCGRDVKYTAEHKALASLWMGVFGAVAFMATLLTVLTFCIDASRFRFPEKPIVFLNVCLFFCSLAYMIRVFGGPEFISCKRSEEVGAEAYLAHEGLESSGCIVVFLLLYYFGLAALVWWGILAVCWFLAAGCQWSHEAIDARASYFHFLAWGLPSGLTITVLILRYVDADELTGLCFVGNHDSQALLSFVIIPVAVLIILGIVFLILGFISLLKIKRIMKCEGTNVQRLEKLIVRIGFFNCFFAFITICWLVCYVFEYLVMDRWEAIAMAEATRCKTERNCKPEYSIADHRLQLIKIALFLILGIASGAWIWGIKTWSSWSTLCKSFCTSRRPEKHFIAYAQVPAIIPPLHLKHKRSKPNYETRV